MNEHKNLILAIVLSGAILIGWNFLFVAPQQEAVERQQARQSEQQQETEIPGDQPQLGAELPTAGSAETELGAGAGVDRERILRDTQRVTIDTDRLSGSIALTGGRIDDLILRNYQETIEADSANIVLLEPTGSAKPYYIQVGWLTEDNKFLGHDVVWKADGNVLSPGRPLTLRWDDGQGLIFERTISVDDNFMFKITQQVRNTGGSSVTLRPYGLVSRTGIPEDFLGFYILHEGLLGVFDGTLKEVDYDELEPQSPIRQSSIGGWLGITDKFWLVALIPDQTQTVQTSFSIGKSNGTDKYQTDYLASPVVVPAGGSAAVVSRVFAGAKEVTLLDDYEEQLGIVNFDLAVDFGWFYFLTKPIFYVLKWLHSALGNFGLGILALTLIFRFILFPLNNKAYRSMSKMKLLAPKIAELKERYAEDRMRFGQEQMALFKREKVNPMAGCLPMFPTFIIFFSLYKVLFVSIEMRHAPFYGWIHDLSAPDPLGVLTLFGLIDWQVPGMLEMVNIGIWPLMMGLTMWLQMRLNPTPADPMQAKIMAMLPFVFTFILAKFPAGLVIYWTWSNILTIAQQWYIKRGVDRDYPDLAGIKTNVGFGKNPVKDSASTGKKPDMDSAKSGKKPDKVNTGSRKKSGKGNAGSRKKPNKNKSGSQG